jgi:hypothetical protein
MECKQETIFTITMMANGQGFTFGIMARTRTEACEQLLEKMKGMAAELEKELHSPKAAN